MKARHFILLLSFFCLFEGCGILKRDRQINHHGVESTEDSLPVIHYESKDPSSRRLLLLLSGDGGWLDFEDQLCTGFAAKGFQTIGFNSRTYFWTGRTPDGTAGDIAALIGKYAERYKSRRIYLCGFSFGADVLPFIYNRLPAALRSRVVSLHLFSPFASSDFMVHTADLLNLAGDDNPYKVQPEVEAIRIPVHCFYGKNEVSRPLEQLQQKNFSIRLVEGDHRYDPSAYQEIFDSVIRSGRNLFFRTYQP